MLFCCVCVFFCCVLAEQDRPAGCVHDAEGRQRDSGEEVARHHGSPVPQEGLGGERGRWWMMDDGLVSWFGWFLVVNRMVDQAVA